jgi:hypothetical protein
VGNLLSDDFAIETRLTLSIKCRQIEINKNADLEKLLMAMNSLGRIPFLFKLHTAHLAPIETKCIGATMLFLRPFHFNFDY